MAETASVQAGDVVRIYDDHLDVDRLARILHVEPTTMGALVKMRWLPDGWEPSLKDVEKAVRGIQRHLQSGDMEGDLEVASLWAKLDEIRHQLERRAEREEKHEG